MDPCAARCHIGWVHHPHPTRPVVMGSSPCEACNADGSRPHPRDVPIAEGGWKFGGTGWTSTPAPAPNVTLTTAATCSVAFTETPDLARHAEPILERVVYVPRALLNEGSVDQGSRCWCGAPSASGSQGPCAEHGSRR